MTGFGTDLGGGRRSGLARLAAVALLLGAPVVPVGARSIAETNRAARVAPDEIVGRAVEHSYALKTSAKEIDAAEARRTQSRAQFLPSVDADGRAAWYSGLKDITLGPGSSIPAVEDRYLAGVGLSQPLFTGGRLIGQKQGADAGAEAARQARIGVGADIVIQALRAYWLWSKAFYSVESFEAALARVRAHLADMQSMHESGLVTDNDLLATEVRVDETQLLLEEARRRVALARADIAYLTGAELAADAQPDRADTGETPAAPSEDEALRMAFINRPERAARRLDTRAAEENIKVQRAGYYPQFYFLARYEQGNPNPLIFPPENEWNYDAFVGFGATWNLLDWGLTRGRAAEAAARAWQARLRQEQTDDQIALEVKESRINLENALARVAVSEHARASAARNLQAATDLWEAGLARHSDVLDAHSKLTDAEFGVISAQADVELARAALEHALGLLNEPSGQEK